MGYGARPWQPLAGYWPSFSYAGFLHHSSYLLLCDKWSQFSGLQQQPSFSLVIVWVAWIQLGRSHLESLMRLQSDCAWSWSHLTSLLAHVFGIGCWLPTRTSAWAVSWDRMQSPCDLGFLTTWHLGSEGEHPKSLWRKQHYLVYSSLRNGRGPSPYLPELRREHPDPSSCWRNGKDPK